MAEAPRLARSAFQPIGGAAPRSEDDGPGRRALSGASRPKEVAWRPVISPGTAGRHDRGAITAARVRTARGRPYRRVPDDVPRLGLPAG